jgi:hypothetical protein
MLRSWAEPAEGITSVAPEAADAPYVDDIIVFRGDQAAFKQLKHSVEGEGAFTGSDLFAKRDGISLIGKLFKGWNKVRTRARIVEVHLTTNVKASEDPRNLLISPADFQQRILVPARSGVSIWPDDLEPILAEIQGLAEAPDRSTLLDFLGGLRLEFSAPDEAEVRGRVIELLRNHLRPGATIEIEADAWVSRVYDLSTRHADAVAFSRDDIDRELRSLFGATPRIMEHRLALPDHHISRPDTVRGILNAALEIRSGYLVVQGPPGCGKTTLATWISNEHDDELLVRYHVFDPKLTSGIERKGRASALEFVKTMFDALSERFPGKVAPYIPVEETLVNAVSTLRGELGRLAEERPRIVIIDGIDHVVRSRVERESLFDALPEQAPPNVVFVLFGQPDWEYPSWLTRVPRLLVPPFSRLETRSHVCRRMGWEFDDLGAAAIADTLHDKSSGNPLSLFYNLAVIENLGTTTEKVGESLEEAALFGGVPHEEYDRLLDDLGELLLAPQGSKSLRRDLLAFFAVAAVGITEARLCAAFSDDNLTSRQARDYLAGLRPVVIEREPGQYWLFHDDFRRYAEERTSSNDRMEAHRRIGKALGHDWHGKELKAWVEHLWLGGQDDLLSNLPAGRSFAEWFRLSTKRAVVWMHRLAFAASFRRGRELEIIRNGLALERAIEVADLPWNGGDGVPAELGIRGWSFVVPPRGVARPSLDRRASALKAAADAYESDPSLAVEIFHRFSVPEEAILRAEEELDDSDVRNYIAALASWFLCSGNLAEVKKLAENNHFGHIAAPSFSSTLLSTVDPDILSSWSEALVGASNWLDRELVRAALVHLSEGRSPSALSIARALAWCPLAAPETIRDASVLLSLIEEVNLTSPASLTSLVRLEEQRATNPEEWREFFLHGFVFTASGSVLELGLCQFPTRFVEAVRRRNGEDIPLAALLWRCGCAAGLACRGQDLLSPGDLEQLLLVFAGKRELGLKWTQQYIFLECVRLYLPLLALAVRRRTALKSIAFEVLAPVARELLAVPSARTYGLLEAIWQVNPEAWREMAAKAYGVTLFPGTEAGGRIEWFRYWATRSGQRGIEPPGEFLTISVVAGLGVPRKTDPAALAVNLLCGRTAPAPEWVGAIRRLVDLLIKLDAEPEGGRSAHRHLSRVLVLALKLDPSLFWDEFLRCTELYSIAEPFGTTPSTIALQWLEESPATKEELLALWYWVAACPGSFSSDGKSDSVARLVQEKLRELGGIEDAASLERWQAALSVRAADDLHRQGSQSFQNGGSIGEIGHGGTAESESSTPSLVSPVRPKPPHISDLKPGWFSSWLSRAGYQTLREYLYSGGEEAWDLIRGRVAEQIATDPDYFGYEAGLIAQGLVDLRPHLFSVDAFEVAMLSLAERVRFQEDPAPRGETSFQRSLPEVFVGRTARGVDVSDVETLRCSLRSLGALARNIATAPFVEREMLRRTGSSEVRSAIHSLLVLRQVPRLKQSSREMIRPLTNSADAWCRWLACSILEVHPEWLPLRILTASPGPISPEVQPSLLRLGAAFYADLSSVREVYVEKLKDLLNTDEHDIRAWLELEFRNLSPLPERSRGWSQNVPGATVVSNRMADAVGCLACRLASAIRPEALPALMAIAARQDPWLVVAEPVVEHPEGWIEICRVASEVKNEREEYLLRVVGLATKELLEGRQGWSTQEIAELGGFLLFPEVPQKFAWVAEPWPIMTPPRMRHGPIIPLCFYSAPFMELVRDRFSLVPNWGLPPFQGLHFEVGDVPKWVHPELGPVIVAAYREQLVDTGGTEHPQISWWTGWYASPAWLATFQRPDMSLIRFWRLEWSDRRWGETQGERTVEFGLQEDVLSTA